MNINVYREGQFLKTVARPVRVVGGRPLVTYKGKQYPIQDGDRIEVGNVNRQSQTASRVGNLTSKHARSDSPRENEWTDAQRSVILAPSNARLVVEAAPGTGKTAVACARVAHLLGEHVPATGIWLISFTRTAIQEIRNRIADLSQHVESAYGVRIATIDSHAWQLRQGYSDKKHGLFSTFDQGIDDAIEMLRDPDDALLADLKSLQHVVIDEAQDIVENRRELLLSLIRLLDPETGVTVLCDPAQAIYGFAEDETEEGVGEPLPELLKQDASLRFEVCTLTEVIRAATPGLQHIFINTRRLVLHPGELAMNDLINDLNDHCDGKLQMAVAKNGVATRDDVLVLYRRRSEVLTSGAYLANAGCPFRLRMSGYPQRISSWHAAVFWDWTSPVMAKAEFQRRFSTRLSDSWNTPDVEFAWKAAIRHAGRSSATIDVKRLREALSRSHPPLEFSSAELGDSGPILGTIHSSKGREAEEVHLMLANLGDDEQSCPDELRVVFVGATRARSVLKIGKSGGRYSSRTSSGRCYRAAMSGMKARVEVGRGGDVDELSLVSRTLFKRAQDAGVMQDYVAKLGGSLAGARLCRVPIGGDEYAWRLFSDDREDAIAQMSDGFNSDLWNVVLETSARRQGRRAVPPMSLNHILQLCCRTVVRPSGDASLPMLHEPWATSGFWLAPVLFGYSTAYFNLR